MSQRKRIGVLTPSSNTALEPLTSAMVAGVPGVSAHFSRFRVTEISMGDKSQNQFDDARSSTRRELLADANVDVICWSGTSASWLGFERDRALCARITEATGIPATTSVLALNELLAAQGARTLGLVSPYVEDVQRRIVANYAALGIECVAERHLDLTVNFSFAEVEPDTLRTHAARSRAEQARRDHHDVHQPARRAAGRRDGARARHPDLRLGGDRGLEGAEARRRRPAPASRAGDGLFA